MDQAVVQAFSGALEGLEGKIMFATTDYELQMETGNLGSRDLPHDAIIILHMDPLL